MAIAAMPQRFFTIPHCSYLYEYHNTNQRRTLELFYEGYLHQHSKNDRTRPPLDYHWIRLRDYDKILTHELCQ